MIFQWLAVPTLTECYRLDQVVAVTLTVVHQDPLHQRRKIDRDLGNLVVDDFRSLDCRRMNALTNDDDDHDRNRWHVHVNRKWMQCLDVD